MYEKIRSFIKHMLKPDHITFLMIAPAIIFDYPRIALALWVGALLYDVWEQWQDKKPIEGRPLRKRKARTAILELIGEFNNIKKLDDNQVKQLILDTVEYDLVDAKTGNGFALNSLSTGDTVVNVEHHGLMVHVLTISKSKSYKVSYLDKSYREQ